MKRQIVSRTRNPASSRSLMLLLLLSTAGACGMREIPVSISLTGVTDSDAPLTIVPYLNGQAGASISVASTDHETVLYLPAGSQGSLRLAVESHDEAGCAASSGEATAAITTPAPWEALRIELPIQTNQPARCRVSVQVQGAASLDLVREATCAPQAACADPDTKQIACTEGQICRATIDVPRGTRLLMHATAIGARNYPSWTADCAEGSPGCPCAPGSTDCNITVSQQSEVNVQIASQLCAGDSTHAGFCMEQPLPGLVDMNAVWGSQPDRVWAVGDMGIIRRLDGWLWPTIPSGTTADLHGIWGNHNDLTNDDDVWAVGDAGTILHYQRQRSRFVRMSSGSDARLFGIFGTGSADIWAVGETGTILHYDGQQWTLLQVPRVELANLNAVWAASATDVWVVGDGGLALHFDGQAWTRWQIGAPDTALRSVWGLGSDSVWAVGDAGVIKHWLGTMWVTETAEVPHDFTAVAGDPQIGVFLVGRGPSWTTHTAVCGEFSSCLWTHAADIGAPAAKGLHGLWVGSDHRMWAVGPEGVITERTTGSWHDVGFTEAPWSAPGGDTWFLGQHAGLIGRWHDGQLRMTDTHTSEGYLASWGDGPNNVWAVGSNGSIVRWNGTDWTQVNSGTKNLLLSVWGSQSGDVWISGRGQTILICRDNGAGVQCTNAYHQEDLMQLIGPKIAGLRDPYFAVRGRNDKQVWVSVQWVPDAFVWDGESWSQETDYRYPPTLVRSENDLWSLKTNPMTGQNELAHTVDGTRWTTCPINSVEPWPIPQWLWVGQTSNVVWMLDSTGKQYLTGPWTEDCTTQWQTGPTGSPHGSYYLYGNDQGDIFTGGPWGSMMRLHE